MIGIVTKGKFGGAIDVQYVVQGTPEFVVDPESLSFEAIYGNLVAWIDGRPDAAVWLDFFAAGAGVTVNELLAGVSTYLSFRIVVSRRETYLQYAEKLTSTIAIAEGLGYSAVRGTNDHLTITVTPDSTVVLEKYSVVGSVKEVDLVVLEDVGLVSGTQTQIEVAVGDKKSEVVTIASDALQWFRFISTNVSEDIRILLNDVEMPVSSVVIDLQDDKYVTLSNAYGAVDVVYFNAGLYNYDSGDILTLEYVELASPVFTVSDLSFDYGVVDSLDITVVAEEAETTTDIKVNAPLYHETELLIRGRDDYKKTFKLLDARFTDTNGYDTSAAVVDLTYVLDDLTFLTAVQKASYSAQLSTYRPFGVQPPTISDPARVYFEIDISIVLAVTTATVQVQTDVDAIMTSYIKLLAKFVDLQAIENSLEDASYVKVARAVMTVATWTASTHYSRGSYVKAITDTGFDYEATAFSSSVSADILAVGADDILNDEGFTLRKVDDTAIVFKFSKDGGAVTGEDATVSIVSGQTATQVASLIQTVVNAYIGFSATVASPDYIVTAIRLEGGALYRVNTETVTNSTFSVSDFEGRQSSGAEPIWPIVLGDTIVDNDITWTTREKLASPPELAWNEFCTIDTNITIT